ncbi:MAG: hypothetical protein CMJ46_00035 [Planctomyces sp.]|nr:hypothetical protein [Planctomyces sp.]
MSIYIEIRIKGSLDDIWEKTQNPELHNLWDARFTSITYLPRADETAPQRFRYATRIGLGIEIEGEGETVGGHAKEGERTSALKFWSQDRKSLIRNGSGYWKYIPEEDGVRFLTRYDYEIRFGWFGRFVDRRFFRPFLGWATAWSFDRLRLWIEKGIDPALSRRQFLVHLLCRLSVAFVWCYHGLVPKILFRHPDEYVMLTDAGVSQPTAELGVFAAGIGEILLGLLTLFCFRSRWPFVATMAVMTVALVGVAINSPRFLVAAFNPVTLNGLLTVMSLIGLLVMGDLPSASRCLRRQPEKEK